jgi:prevent-host-death family protein
MPVAQHWLHSIPSCAIFWSERPKQRSAILKAAKRSKPKGRHPSNRWSLQDAKAKLSEVVRQARERGPQRVTVHGRDAVVVVRAEEFDRMRRPISGRDLLAMMASSPLTDVDFERLSIKSSIRDVEL